MLIFNKKKWIADELPLSKLKKKKKYDMEMGHKFYKTKSWFFYMRESFMQYIIGAHNWSGGLLRQNNQIRIGRKGDQRRVKVVKKMVSPFSPIFEKKN